MGLDIPVNNAAAMGVLQAPWQICMEKCSVSRQLRTPFFSIYCLQRDAVDQLHDNVVDVAGGGDVVHADDIRMREHRDGLGLRLEAAAEFLVLAKIRPLIF